MSNAKARCSLKTRKLKDSLPFAFLRTYRSAVSSFSFLKSTVDTTVERRNNRWLVRCRTSFRKEELYRNSLCKGYTNCCESWIEIVTSARPYILQQNETLAHTNLLLQNWLYVNTSMFWNKSFWHFNSPV